MRYACTRISTGAVVVRTSSVSVGHEYFEVVMVFTINPTQKSHLHLLPNLELLMFVRKTVLLHTTYLDILLTALLDQTISRKHMGTQTHFVATVTTPNGSRHRSFDCSTFFGFRLIFSSSLILFTSAGRRTRIHSQRPSRSWSVSSSN